MMNLCVRKVSYSAECVEGKFCDVRVDGVLRSWASPRPAVGASGAPRADEQRFVPDVCYYFFCFWSCCCWASTFFRISSTFCWRQLTSFCTVSTFFFRSSTFFFNFSCPASTFFFTSCPAC